VTATVRFLDYPKALKGRRFPFPIFIQLKAMAHKPWSSFLRIPVLFCELKLRVCSPADGVVLRSRECPFPNSRLCQ